MPPSGFPVFRRSPRGRISRPLLSWTSAPLQGVHHVLRRRAPTGAPTLASRGRAGRSAALLSVSCSSAHAAARVHDGGRCHVPPVPVRGVSTPSTGRTSRSTLFGLPGLSHPGNAPELPSTGLSSSRRSGSRLRALPPLPLCGALRRRTRLRRIDPSENRLPKGCVAPARDPCPPDVPSLRLSLSLPCDRAFPDAPPSRFAFRETEVPLRAAPRSLPVQRAWLLSRRRSAGGDRPL